MHRARLAFASVSVNNVTTVYAGVAIAKDTLQISLCGASENLPNDARGRTAFCASFPSTCTPAEKCPW